MKQKHLVVKKTIRNLKKGKLQSFKQKTQYKG